MGRTLTRLFTELVLTWDGLVGLGNLEGAGGSCFRLVVVGTKGFVGRRNALDLVKG